MTLFALLMFLLNLILLTLFTNSCFNFFHSPFFTRIRSRFSKKPSNSSPGRSSSSSPSPSTTTPTNTNNTNTNLPPFLLTLLNRLHSLPLPPLHTTVFVLTTVNLCSLILSITQIEAMIATNAQLLLGSSSGAGEGGGEGGGGEVVLGRINGRLDRFFRLFWLLIRWLGFGEFWRRSGMLGLGSGSGRRETIVMVMCKERRRKKVQGV
ncbi:hypothetical protein K435DRAFT_458121 [Dendrothele bispora CBS 962.96]|uniref:Transmembrane protein n=1 Tax=Dendrothele bispora (strain CBS 962.96) TaxID=1314807 RepID=A0A4S8MDB3_DENBC|nr:hypothetical protein K435DRAFT_458121 [Dendrothele bispora CBS 962.96]